MKHGKNPVISRVYAVFYIVLFRIAINLGLYYLTLGIAAPTLMGFILTVLVYFVIGVILFMLAHGIANFFRKFGPAYGVSMTLYFVFMILGGMMGIRQNQLPPALRFVSKLLPLSYVSEDLYVVWLGKSYNWMPLIQSLLFLGGVSAIIMLLSFRYRKNQAIK